MYAIRSYYVRALAPWIAAAVPVAAVMATVAAFYALRGEVLLGLRQDERVVGGALIAFVALSAAAVSAYWMQLLVHHFGEQVRLREQRNNFV